MDFLSLVSKLTTPANEFLAKANPELAPFFVFGFVVLFLFLYVVFYFIPSFLLSWRLRRLARKLKEINKLMPAERRTKLNECFSENKLEHAWKEYSETLHNQYSVHDGEQKLLCSRATVGASHFFSDQAVIETPLVTEFFKHLPGILTGIGIVGTFFGLMLGLQHFDPSTPEKVNESVANLLHDVFLAFLGSFIAIAASIIVTLSEKWRLGRCYKRLEVLTEAVDRLFDSGVGEEYLAELVKSSNESSVQTRQLKDSLVTDLREMMQNLVDSQVRENLKLTESLTGAIENSLKAPMTAIAGAVEKASTDQTGKVGNLLEDVMVGFMEQLKNTFGQQFNGLHEMMGQSVAAMQSMQGSFSGLIQDMRDASQSTSQNSASLINQMIMDIQAGQNAMQAGMTQMLEQLQASVARIGSEGEGAGIRMAEQLEAIFKQSEARQESMSANMQSFIDAMNQNVAQGQQDTMAQISGSVSVLEEQLAGMFKQFEQGREKIDNITKTTQIELFKGARQTIAELESQVKTLLQAVSEQVTASRETIKVHSAQTEQHIQGMQLGADKMRVAAERFETAGNSVTKATEATANVMSAVQGVSVELSSASREMNSVVADYRNNREALNKTLEVIEGVAASAQSDAATRNQFIQDLKRQSEQMQAFNREVNECLEHMSEILGKGFNEFSEGMDRSLSKTLGSLDNELNKVALSLGAGVGLVRESLDDFGEILEKARR